MAAKLRLVTAQKQPAKRAKKDDSKPRGTLKQQREELLAYLYSEAEEGVSWFRSAQARYRNKNVSVNQIISDFHGAGVIAECAPRDAYLKWPGLFRSDLPTQREFVKARLDELAGRAAEVQGLFDSFLLAVKKKDLVAAVEAGAVLEMLVSSMMLGFTKEKHEAVNRYRTIEREKFRASR